MGVAKCLIPTSLAPRLRSEVAFPSQKAQVFERSGWHTGPNASFFAFPEQRVAVLMADGSAALWITGTSNQGWNPANPRSPSQSVAEYAPAPP